MSNYRNRKILDLAQQHPCTAPGCGTDDGTIVAAHSNQGKHGKGGNIKAHDCFVAYLCSACHHFVDQDTHASRQERVGVWDAAHEKTIPLFRHLLNAKGWETIAGEVL